MMDRSLDHTRARLRSHAARARFSRLAGPVVVIAMLLALSSVSVANGSAAGREHDAKRALERHGYSHLELTCAGGRRRTRCGWTGQRVSARCTGTLTVADIRPRRPAVKIRRQRCSPLGPLVGFNTFSTPDTVADQTQLGATVSRMFVDWSLVEPVPGAWAWEQPDAEYQAILTGGVKPLIVADTAPCWARPSTSCLDPYFTGPPDPAYDSDWIAYLHDLVLRYPEAAGIEIWNEPNLDQLFVPAADPARYTELLKEAYTTIKAVDPSMPVISGGLLLSPPVAGSGKVPGGYGADQFLAAMYADGAKSYMDALGVHIYPSDYVNGQPATWDPNAMTSWLSQLNSVRVANGESSQPIWITEMGISTVSQPGWPPGATPAQQADDLASMIAIARQHRSVRAIIIHTLENSPAVASLVFGALAGSGPGFGVLTASGGKTPAACAVSRAFGGSLGC
jgi:Glycosyl hydrolase catalytic core